jgi:hypothetical protein
MKRESGEPTSLRGHRKDFTNHPCLFLAKKSLAVPAGVRASSCNSFRASSLPESQW